MSYAIISSWTSTPEAYAASGGQDTLNNVIVPMVKASPGFLRAHWTEAIDGRTTQSYWATASTTRSSTPRPWSP